MEYKDRFVFERYVDRARWNSYFNQIKGVEKSGAEKILLVGIGDGIVPSVLRHMGKSVTTFDNCAELHPDIVGDVREIGSILKGNLYDGCVCCEVLEHLPFLYFEGIIEQIYELLVPNAEAEGQLILSLPQGGYGADLVDIVSIREGSFHDFQMTRTGADKEFVPNGSHRWEVGFKGYSKERILKILNPYFLIEYEGTSFQVPYHWFVRAKKRLETMDT